MYVLLMNSREDMTLFLFQWWQNDKVSCLRLFQDSKSIHGFNLIQLLSRGSNETRRYLGDIMHKVFVLYKEGKIKPVVDSVFTFEEVCHGKDDFVRYIIAIIQVNNAMGKLVERKNIGKVVIEPFPNSKTEKVKKVGRKTVFLFSKEKSCYSLDKIQRDTWSSRFELNIWS